MAGDLETPKIIIRGVATVTLPKPVEPEPVKECGRQTARNTRRRD